MSRDDDIIANLVGASKSETTPKYSWDEDYQRLILGMLLTDRYFLVQSQGLIEPIYFTNEAHAEICRALFSYFNEYNGLMPSKIILTQELKDRLKSRPEALRNFYIGELNTVLEYYISGLDSRELLLDKITNFAKCQSLKKAYFESFQEIRKAPEEEGTWSKVHEIIRQSMLVDRQFDMGLDYFGSFEERYQRMIEEEQTRPRFTLGFRPIDEAISGGGGSAGELYAWMSLPGVGKTHLRGTRVLMFDGTVKCVEDIVAGDVVMGNDSTPRKVLSTHRLWDKVYEIKPVKGNSYYVNSKHVLSLKNSHRQGGLKYNRPTRRCKNPSFVGHFARMGNTDIFNISVEDWFEQSEHFRIKMKGWRTGVSWPEKDVVIDPYILGVWLGDGSSCQAQLTNTDPVVIEAWRRLEDETLRYQSSDGFHHNLLRKGTKRNALMDKIRACNLFNNKHIPCDYKINCREVRLQILAGLLDADGHRVNNCYEITQKSRVLAEDILFVARSLGFAAYMKLCTKCDQFGHCDEYCRIHISGDCSEIPVRIEYKKCHQRKQVKNHLMTGISVISHKVKGEFFGFETDGNHLYLLDDFTVVHNSLAMVQGSVHNVVRGKKVLYITLEMDQDKVAQRFDAQFTNVNIGQLYQNRVSVFSALNYQVRELLDKRMLIIKQFPPGMCDVAMIRAFQNQCTLHGFKPDMLVVDYVGEMKDIPNIPTWESRYRILRDLRGFGVEEQHFTLTALQPNRDAAKMAAELQNAGAYLTSANLGDSFGQFRPLDGLFGINQTDNERRAALGRVNNIKLRDGKAGFKFKIGFDYNGGTLKMFEIDDRTYASELSKIKDDIASQVSETLQSPRSNRRQRKNYDPSEGEAQ